MQEICVLGVDLAGVAHRPTGMCVLRGLKAKTFLSYSDDEILACACKEKPELVVIDAPLNLPPGRKSIEDRNGEHYRVCDLELRKRKIPFFPITLGPMRLLTVRGIELRKRLESRGSRVAEMYPGGAQDIWGIPRARRDLPGLRRGLQRLGIKGLKKGISDHELDATTGALVGRLFLQDRAEVYGNFTEGAILMPKPLL
ncbi:MAG: DUF429 domain-containing protein [Candidatus Aminicenantes bacterium]